jgi:hypothetical protein
VTHALLLDTHIALWLDSGDDHLRPSTRALIEVLAKRWDYLPELDQRVGNSAARRHRAD